jgi:hypothetical protein
VRGEFGLSFVDAADSRAATQAFAEDFLDFGERRFDECASARQCLEAVGPVRGEVHESVVFDGGPGAVLRVFLDGVKRCRAMRDGDFEARLSTVGGVREAARRLDVGGQLRPCVREGLRLVPATGSHERRAQDEQLRDLDGAVDFRPRSTRAKPVIGRAPSRLSGSKAGGVRGDDGLALGQLLQREFVEAAQQVDEAVRPILQAQRRGVGDVVEAEEMAQDSHEGLDLPERAVEELAQQEASEDLALVRFGAAEAVAPLPGRELRHEVADALKTEFGLVAERIVVPRPTDGCDCLANGPGVDARLTRKLEKPRRKYGNRGGVAHAHTLTNREQPTLVSLHRIEPANRRDWDFFVKARMGESSAVKSPSNLIRACGTPGV